VSIHYQDAHDAMHLLFANLSLWSDMVSPTGAIRRIESHLQNGGTISDGWKIGGVELVVVPRIQGEEKVLEYNLFGNKTERIIHNLLHQRIATLGYPISKQTEDEINLAIPIPGSDDWAGCKIYTPEPETFGTCLALTTGPQEFISRLPILKGDKIGFRKWEMVSDGEPIECPSEHEFFEYGLQRKVAPPHLRKWVGLKEEEV